MSALKKIAKYAGCAVAGVVALVILFVVVVNGAPDVILGGISSSRTYANVPNESNFDAFLKRDLATYFTQKLGASSTVEYELLRDGPTQSGIAYPKYYAWVVVHTATSELQGALRIAAIDKQEFSVTDFVSNDNINNNPGSLEELFPSALLQKIKQHSRHGLLLGEQ